MKTKQQASGSVIAKTLSSPTRLPRTTVGYATSPKKSSASAWSKSDLAASSAAAEEAQLKFSRATAAITGHAVSKVRPSNGVSRFADL